MDSIKINSKNLISNYNAYNNSFASAIRYIADIAKEAEGKIPAAPAKEDKSEEASALRAEIKKTEARNVLITDCKMIVTIFAVTANDLKSKGINALCKRITECLPNVDEEGRAVKFAKLPSYLKEEVTDYKTRYIVTRASWIEAIIAAAENNGNIRRVYSLTIPPVIADGELIEAASGDIVNDNGHIVETGNILTMWDKFAVINNIANNYGREMAKERRSELKGTK